MYLEAARYMSMLLASVVLAVSIRSPRHRPLAAWLLLSVAYTLSSRSWIPSLAVCGHHVCVGPERVKLHLAHALYLATNFASVHAVWSLGRVPRRLAPLPWFFASAALLMLVDGYAKTGNPALYVVGALSFASGQMYTAVEVVANGLRLGLVPWWRRVVDECHETDDMAALATVVALQIAALAHMVLGYFHADGPGVLALTMLAGYSAGVVIYVPVLVSHVMGERSDWFVRGRAVALRREAIYSMGRRVDDARATLRRADGGRKIGPRSFPTAMPLVVRAGLSLEFVDLMARDFTAAAAVEFSLAIAWGLGAGRATALLTLAEQTIEREATRLSVDRSTEMPWRDVFQRCSLGPSTFYEPFAMALFAMLRDLTWDQSREAIRFARRTVEILALRSGSTLALWS